VSSPTIRGNPRSPPQVLDNFANNTIKLEADFPALVVPTPMVSLPSVLSVPTELGLVKGNPSVASRSGTRG
jgi:hypothetical protein